MITNQFITTYEATKLKNLQSIQIINDIEGTADKYYKINLSENDIQLNCDFEEWNTYQFLDQIYKANIKYVEVFIHKGYKKDFVSLEEFMLYVQLIKNNNSLIHFNQHQFTKNLNKEEFFHNVDLYINEYFMQCINVLDIIYYDTYIKGSFYSNASFSFISLGCELENEYWAFN